MTSYEMSTSISPVPVPGPDAVAPDVHRGVYPMPMFVTLPTPDLAASVDFWVRGLGFIDLFTIPGRLTHLRRWTFQDVLLVPGDRPDAPPAASVSIACVEQQLAQIQDACEQLVPGCTSGPQVMPWNSVELRVVTPENAHVVLTAARPVDPRSAEAQQLRDIGIEVPGA